MIELDGSFGEGGGQILRSGLALSLLTGKAFRLRKIRANRPKPGLQPQHLMSVRAAAQVGNAEVSGDAIGSWELTFRPGSVTPGAYRFDIGTAGGTGLVLHTVYLPLALRCEGTSVLRITGGTHNDASPCFHFLAATWAGYLARMGLRVEVTMERAGFYPRGGGRIVARISPCAGVKGLRLTRLEKPLTRASGFSAVAGLPDHVAKRQARRAAFRLEREGVEADIRQESWDGGPGSVLGVTFDDAPVPTLFFGLGARGKPAETVADEAVEQAVAYLRSDAPVDPHSADQIVLPLAFADGPSEFRTGEVTKHLTTNVAVIQHFVERKIDCDTATGVVRIGPPAV
jgi:RNA 3'-terminal phosphate cyclase (ATP)